MRIRRFIGRRGAALLLLAALCLGMITPAAAFNVTALEAADTLHTLGLFKGTDEGYELDRALTRQEAAVMFVRLMGREDEAEGGFYSHPFSDVDPWAEACVGYGWENGLVKGVDDGRLDSDREASIRDLLTYVLRALGYEEWVDFKWATALEFARSIGLVSGEYSSGAQMACRRDAVLIFYAALTFQRGGEQLIDRLYADGDVSYAQLVESSLAGHVNQGRKKYTAAQTYARCSSAVFLVNAYADEKGLEADEPAGYSSGFFVSEDGLALMSYHGLDMAKYARIVMKDGLTYDIERVLDYDTHRDYLLARVSKTAVTGERAERFPYIPLGDPDAAAEGTAVYAIGNPLGISSIISDGIVGGRSRELYGMPFIHFSASVSSGSSGGPVLNEYGEAIGIVFGSYVQGQVLNLAVPVDAVPKEAYSAVGEPLTAVYSCVEKQRQEATLHVDIGGAAIRVGETLKVAVTRSCPGDPSIMFETTSQGIVEIRWAEDYRSMSEIDLYITGLEPGDAEIVITYNDEDYNQEARAVINVLVEP